MKNLELHHDLVILASEDFENLDARVSLISSRIAQENRVYIFQPMISVQGMMGGYLNQVQEGNIHLIQPFIPTEISVFERREFQKAILTQLLEEESIHQYAIWTDSPRYMPFIRHLSPSTIIYSEDASHRAYFPVLHHELKQYADVVLNQHQLSEAAFEALGAVNLWRCSMQSLSGQN